MIYDQRFPSGSKLDSQSISNVTSQNVTTLKPKDTHANPHQVESGGHLY